MYNTIIIGSGPAGMAAALYLQRSGLKTLIIDKDAPGGQMLKTDKIENYLGFKSISGFELAAKMNNQLEVDKAFGEVTEITKDNYFTVKTNNDTFTSKNVVIATGKVNNKLNLPLEDKIKGISYCAVCDGAFYKDKTVAIVGAGNSAFTEALYLSNICLNVYIINRSENIKADNELQTRVKNKENIIYISNSVVTSLKEEDNILTGIVLNNKEELPVNGLFLAIGGKPKLDFIKNVKNDNGYLIVNEKKETNIPGLYGAGDVIKKDYYQIITALNDGVCAALSIKERE